MMILFYPMVKSTWRGCSSPQGGCFNTGRIFFFQHMDIHGISCAIHLLFLPWCIILSHWNLYFIPPESLTWKLKSFRNPIGKDRLPTTIFQGRAVNLRGGIPLVLRSARICWLPKPKLCPRCCAMLPRP